MGLLGSVGWFSVLNGGGCGYCSSTFHREITGARVSKMTSLASLIPYRGGGVAMCWLGLWLASSSQAWVSSRGCWLSGRFLGSHTTYPPPDSTGQRGSKDHSRVCGFIQEKRKLAPWLYGKSHMHTQGRPRSCCHSSLQTIHHKYSNFWFVLLALIFLQLDQKIDFAIYHFCDLEHVTYNRTISHSLKDWNSIWEPSDPIDRKSVV